MSYTREFLGGFLFIYIVMTVINLCYDGDIFEGMGRNVNRYENVLISLSLVISSVLFGLSVFENVNCIKMLGVYSAIASLFFFVSGIIYIVDVNFREESKQPIQGILNIYIGVVLTYFAYLLIMQRNANIKKEKESKEKAAAKAKEDKIAEMIKQEQEALKQKQEALKKEQEALRRGNKKPRDGENKNFNV